MLHKLAMLVLAVSTAGCAVRPYSDASAFAERTGANSFEVFDRDLDAPDTLVLPVVHDRQTSGPSCGAHALASVINYWRDAPAVSGTEIYAGTPPARPAGYSLAELTALAHENGLLASPVRMPSEGLVQELERGRPVLIPVRIPSVYIQQRTLPGSAIPLVGTLRNSVIDRAAWLSEQGETGLIDHYLLVVGYEGDTFVVVEPVRGYRTISRERLSRYRTAFGEAAIVFSASPGGA